MLWELKTKTPVGWVATALRDFDAFLIDHASCERKASAVGMSLVVRYPDRHQILEPMIQFAREELEHFHQVYKLILQRGLTFGTDEEDPYVKILMKEVRTGRDERFLDRLLAASVIEARGTERMHLVADHLDDEILKIFYRRLARAENQHKDLFVDLALLYFTPDVVSKRLEEFLTVEADAIQSIPFRAALH